MLHWFGRTDTGHGELAFLGNHSLDGSAFFIYEEAEPEKTELNVFLEAAARQIDLTWLRPETKAAPDVPGRPAVVPFVALEALVELTVDGRKVANPATGQEDLVGRAWAWRDDEGRARLLARVEGPTSTLAPKWSTIEVPLPNGPVDESRRFTNPSVGGRFVGELVVEAAPVPGATSLRVTVLAPAKDDTYQPVLSRSLEPSGTLRVPVELPLDRPGRYLVEVTGRAVDARLRLEGRIEPPPAFRLAMEWEGVLEGYDAEIEMAALEDRRPQAVPVGVPNKVDAYAPRGFAWPPVIVGAAGAVAAGLFVVRLGIHRLDVTRVRGKK